MPSILPLSLSGQTLGARHLHFNRSVAAAEQDQVPFSSVQHLPESTPVDRLFKIQLASRLKFVQYIVDQLQEDDLLYVSSALRATWLVQHEEIINPVHLEQVLYPAMVGPAVSKLRHWLYIHLRDPAMCRSFYQYYRDNTFHYAMKFLWRCSNDFILDEAPKILQHLTPRYLKLLCEKCPRVAKLFFGAFEANPNVRSMYVNEQKKYYESIKCVLKSDADIFLDIIEKYFNFHLFDKLSRDATSYIMKHHRDRFDSKPELYAMWLLDMGAVAQALTGAECERLVLRLARAQYLHYLFSYKAVEPLIKRVDRDKRTALKKTVFVKKDFGEIVEDWPYAIPEQPDYYNYDVHIFEDREHELPMFNFGQKRMIKKKMCYYKSAYCDVAMAACSVYTPLNKLYDEFRFCNFNKTFFELKKRLKAESSVQNRQYMMLVLVSKSGSRPESVETLLEFLNEQHSNEPVQLRAAVVRSVVKRACGWRLSAAGWQTLLGVARGLGLDGAPPEAACVEGLHAAVLRHLLDSTDCPSPLLTAFFGNFSTFKEYSLNSDEKKCVTIRLPQLLLKTITVETDPQLKVQRFDNILDTLSTYKLRAGACKGLVPAVAKFAEAHPKASEDLLRRLFRDKVARRQLFRENFPLIQTDASYVNALRHGTVVLKDELFLKSLTKNNLKPEQFLRKLSVYFSESHGLANRFYVALNAGLTDTTKPENCLVRPMVYLAGLKLEPVLKSLGAARRKSFEARLAGAMRANVHVARPPLDIDAFGWRKAGARAVVNRVMACRAGDVDQNALKLATWRNTARASLALTSRATNHYDLFSAVAAVRPKVILQVVVTYFQRHYRGDPRIWAIVESVFESIDLSDNLKLCQRLLRFKSIPAEVRAKYCTVLYISMKRVKYSEELLKFKQFEQVTLITELVNLISFVQEKFTERIIGDFIKSGIHTKADDEGPDKIIMLYMSMIAKFLLLCKSEETQSARLKNIGEPLFEKIAQISTSADDKAIVLKYFNEFLLGLKYVKVFLDPEYVSCLPVLERVAAWMKDILPLEIGFQRFAHLHISMLYFKAIRQCVRQAPGLFSDAASRQREGVHMVGRALGMYIAQEVAHLREQYFDSIVELYKQALISYIDEYFEWDTDRVKGRFIAPVIMGILESAKGNETRLSVHLRDNYSNLDEDMNKNLNEIFKEKAKGETLFLAQSLGILEGNLQ